MSQSDAQLLALGHPEAELAALYRNTGTGWQLMRILAPGGTSNKFGGVMRVAANGSRVAVAEIYGGKVHVLELD